MESVKEVLKESMLDMQANFEQRMTNFEAELHKKQSSSSNFTNLADEFSSFKKFTMETLKTLQMQISLLAREVDNMETRSRRQIILLHGVSEHSKEETSQVVAQTIKDYIKISSFSIDDINRCHRMGRPSSSDKPRPILVKLQSVACRDKIWSSKTVLKGTGITVSEFLTKTRHATFMAAREKYGITKCWTREGCVFLISSDGKRHRVASIDDLNNIKDAGPDKQTAPRAAAVPKQKRTAAGAKK